MPSSDQPNARSRDRVDVIIDGWRETRPDLDVTPVAVVTRLGRLRTLIEPQMERVFAEHGLTTATFSAIAAIARLEGDAGVSQVRLMQALSLTSGTVSVRVDRLVADGLAERLQDPDDRRGARIRLTPLGRERFARAAPAHLENERRLLAALDPERQLALADLLRLLLLDLEGPADAADARPLGLDCYPAHETAAMRRAVGLEEHHGLLVRSVTAGSPADAVGVLPGDLVVEVEGRTIHGAGDLPADADRPHITVLRAGTRRRLGSRRHTRNRVSDT